MPWYLEIKKIRFKDPITTVKVVLVIHYLLTIIGAIGTFNPAVYLFYNFIVIALLIWSIYAQTGEPLRLAIILNMCSIVLDGLYIVALADSWGSYKIGVSMVASILHLIFRPFSILLLMKKDEKLNTSNNNEGKISEINDSNPNAVLP